jgi:hypothetical protein
MESPLTEPVYADRRRGRLALVRPVKSVEPSASRNRRGIDQPEGSQQREKDVGLSCRAESGDFAGFAQHLVDLARVKLLGIDHLPGVFLDDD